jgi:transposase
MEKLLSLILKLTKSQNSRVVFIVLNFLEILQLFEPAHSEKVKKKKFKTFNRSFIDHVESITKMNENIEYDEFVD